MADKRASDDNRGKCPPNDPRDVPRPLRTNRNLRPSRILPDPDAPPYVVGTSWRDDRRNRFEF